MGVVFDNIVFDWIYQRKDDMATIESDVSYDRNQKYDSVTRSIKSIIFMVMGVAAATIGLKGFLLPNSFIDGGVTGISLITTKLTEMPFSILLVVINLPFILLGYSTIGRAFAVKSVIMIILLSVAVYYTPIPSITHDNLLIAFFGGFFLGAGIGLAMRGGGVIDGTEVLALYVSKKSSLSVGDVILVFNLIIFSFGAFVFSVEIAMYAILTYLAASKTVDFVTDGIEEYIGVTIISESSDEIRVAIIERLGRGCTLYYGKRGYAKRGNLLRKTDIVYTLVTRLELSRLKSEVLSIDPSAFMIMHSVKDAKGGLIKRRPLK